MYSDEVRNPSPKKKKKTQEGVGTDMAVNGMWEVLSTIVFPLSLFIFYVDCKETLNVKNDII